MREHLTGQLRSVLDRAQELARGLNQEYVSTEHLLLGTLECETCEACQALRLHEMDPAELRDGLLRLLPQGEETPVVSGDLPLSPNAKQAITDALARAGSNGGGAGVSTRFALAALLQEPDTLIRQCLRAAGADVEQLQRLLAQPPSEPEE